MDLCAGAGGAAAFANAQRTSGTGGSGTGGGPGGGGHRAGADIRRFLKTDTAAMGGSGAAHVNTPLNGPTRATGGGKHRADSCGGFAPVGSVENDDASGFKPVVCGSGAPKRQKGLHDNRGCFNG